MLISVLNSNPTFEYFLPFGLIVLFGATLIAINPPPYGVSAVGHGNTSNFYITSVEYVLWYTRHCTEHIISVNPLNNSWVCTHFSF